ncbi:MAG TPA: hypothetical protein DDX54_06920 [Rhodospirillaceae bacterium]|nr:hypothetical protein [Rhodospirillaceae bacterium]
MVEQTENVHIRLTPLRLRIRAALGVPGPRRLDTKRNARGALLGPALNIRGGFYLYLHTLRRFQVIGLPFRAGGMVGAGGQAHDILGQDAAQGVAR